MSNTAAATKAAKSTAPPAAEVSAPVATPTPSATASAPPISLVKPAAQTLREAQPRKFVPSSLQSLGQDFDILCIKVPSDWEFEDVLKPVAWANVASLVAKDALNTRRDKIGSLIYARSESGKFKVLLTIEGITLDAFGQANGLKVEPWITDNKSGAQ